MEIINNLLFSSLSALVARTLTHPLDTIKTRTQFATTEATKAILRTKGLFNGLGVTLLFSVPGTAVYLTAYDELKTWFGREGSMLSSDSLLVHALSGGIAEAVSGIFWTPMEVLKTKMQTGVSASGRRVGDDVKMNSLRLARDIVREQGVTGLYRGYLLSQSVFIPYTVVYFSTYEKLKKMSLRIFHNNDKTRQLSFGNYVACASASGAIAGAISNILDVVKTRVQVTSAKSTVEVIRNLWINEGGPIAFTKGMFARIMWVTPSMAISISVYELLKNNWSPFTHERIKKIN